jgi:hypothetical protein
VTYLTSRAYYKARILLVPLGPSGAALVSAISDAGLREVLIATPASHPTAYSSARSTYRRPNKPRKPSATLQPART